MGVCQIFRRTAIWEPHTIRVAADAIVMNGAALAGERVVLFTKARFHLVAMRRLQGLAARPRSLRACRAVFRPG